MYDEILAGYQQDPESVFKLFDIEDYQGLVVVSDINFYSLCEHHMIPFFGTVNIGYLPDKKIIGLSKFARLVDIYARRLQTQENMTKQIADAIEKYLKPRGLIVDINAQHLCMAMRGVKRKDCNTRTTIIRGDIENSREIMSRFYQQINKGAR
jgi:GTP cyclohydrolase I